MTAPLRRVVVVTGARLAEHDIADAIVHLASSPYVTGQILAVDGGLSVA